MSVVYLYNENVKGVTAHWHCSVCGADFYEGAGGEPAHMRNCPSENSYENCVLTFGPAAVKEVVERTKGMSSDTPWWNLAVNICKQLGVLQ